jgi:hypothetical protein
MDAAMVGHDISPGAAVDGQTLGHLYHPADVAGGGDNPPGTRDDQSLAGVDSIAREGVFISNGLDRGPVLGRYLAKGITGFYNVGLHWRGNARYRELLSYDDSIAFDPIEGAKLVRRHPKLLGDAAQGVAPPD